MSYYRYLQKYPAGFLAQYQAGSYTHLQRFNNYADIVNMNATMSMTTDEDLTMRYRLPYTISNILGALTFFYWYMTHANMYQANILRNRLRSYHNYKMWARLERMGIKCSVDRATEVRTAMEGRYLQHYNISREQLDTLVERTQGGEELEDVLQSMGLEWNATTHQFVQPYDR